MHTNEPEMQTCRDCRHDVIITCDENGMVEQTDGYGAVICDSCWSLDIHYRGA